MTSQQLIKKLDQTKKASIQLGMSSVSKRNQALREIGKMLAENTQKILSANKKDLCAIAPHDPMRDRLVLTKERIALIIKDTRTVVTLDDPLYHILEQRELPNRLKLKKVTVPFGVIGVIYESRPNVTVDAVSLCLKSGNAVILKGGTDAWHSNQILVKLMKQAIKKVGLDESLILNIDPRNRKIVRQLLRAKDSIDLIIPRGSASLINFVQDNARMPFIETGAGVCHSYVDESADIQMAADIVYNAKTARPSVCNALDTLIVHQKIAPKLLLVLSQKLADRGVVVFADTPSHQILKQLNYPYLQQARQTDFWREFLSLKMAIKTVKNVNEALDHISKYSTKHSEAIVTENSQNAELFLNAVDAACVYHNASTRFSDGAQFGLGGEIGISTQKLHARGPMSIKELTTYKWVIEGTGQVRE